MVFIRFALAFFGGIMGCAGGTAIDFAKNGLHADIFRFNDNSLHRSNQTVEDACDHFDKIEAERVAEFQTLCDCNATSDSLMATCVDGCETCFTGEVCAVFSLTFSETGAVSTESLCFQYTAGFGYLVCYEQTAILNSAGQIEASCRVTVNETECNSCGFCKLSDLNDNAVDCTNLDPSIPVLGCDTQVPAFGPHMAFYEENYTVGTCSMTQGTTAPGNPTPAPSSDVSSTTARGAPAPSTPKPTSSGGFSMISMESLGPAFGFVMIAIILLA